MENTSPIKGFKKFLEAYEVLCKPYCQEIGLSVQAFEILLYISKNKNAATAQNICKEQNIKPTLMSFHIEKLVQSGYVERQTMDGNRRSIKLVCTEKAAPVIKKGAEISARYTALIWEGVSGEEREHLIFIMDKIKNNANKIIQGEF